MLLMAYILIIVFLFSMVNCGIFDDDDDEKEELEKYEYDPEKLEELIQQSVKTKWRSSGEFHCIGTIITSRTVLTSCQCIGTFTLVGQFYEFKEFDVSELVMESISGKVKYNIKKNLIHNHCRPSKWDIKVNVFDIGGWVIQESFDMSIFHVAFPPDDNRQFIEGDTLRFELNTCALPHLTSMTKMRANNITFSDMTNCIKRYCIRRSLHESDCFEVQKSSVIDSEMCASSAYPVEPHGVRGASFSCRTNFTGEKVYLWGTVTDSSFGTIIFSRLDNDENKNFVKKLDQGCQPSNRISSFLFAFIIFINLSCSVLN